MANKVNNITTAQWENIASSIAVSLFIGVPGMVALIYGTRIPRKSHFMNVFSILFFALFSSAMLVRCFYWVTWLRRGTPGDPDDQGMPISIRAFLITYPQLNILICTFLI